VGSAADDLLSLWKLRWGAPAPFEAEVSGVRQRREPTERRDLAVSGGDLIARGLTGPAVGQALDRLLDRVLQDPALNERATLLSLLEEPA
jgi:hypothetical protein